MEHQCTKEVLELYSNNRPIREISRKLKLNRYTVKRILKKNNITIRESRASLIAMGYIKEKKKFILDNQEKAYLFGLVMGDLTPVRKSNYTLKLITHTTHTYFADLLYKTFKKYGIANYKINRRNEYRFHAHLDLESFSFLLGTKCEILPDWIGENNFFSFLAGFIDSDGSIFIRNNNFEFVIRLFSQNSILLYEVKNRLEKLGYNLSIHKNHSKGEIRYHKGVLFRYNKDYYALETYKKDQTLNLLRKIPIRHPEKIAKRKLIYKISENRFNHWSEIVDEINELKLLIKQSTLVRKWL